MNRRCICNGINASVPMDPSGFNLSPLGQGCNNNDIQWSSNWILLDNI